MTRKSKAQQNQWYAKMFPPGHIYRRPEWTDHDMPWAVETTFSRSHQSTGDSFYPPIGPRLTYPDFTTQRERERINANQRFVNTGPTPQPLRFPGFASQQGQPNRNTPLVSGRLQNTKLGEFAIFNLFSDLAEFSKAMVQAGHLVGQ